MFTQVRSASRRVSPAPETLAEGRSVMRVVYVVLEPQYQNALTTAALGINETAGGLAVELSGYLIEELRDPVNYADFCEDVARADVFIASLIFIEDLAGKVVEAVAPHRARLKAAVVFPSMPEVMRLNKLGTFSMAQLGQSKSAISQFMKKRREKGGSTGFQDAMLKLLNTLPTVLKYLPVDKAQDARSFMQSFQYWLGGTPDNLRNFLLMLADRYVFSREAEDRPTLEVADPVVFPDLGIWHPLAPGMFEDLREYLNWNASRTDRRDGERSGPVIGLVLQRSHIVTGDEAHYVAVIQELEYRGATVIPVFCGGLDFSKPVNRFFYDPLDPERPLVDGVVSLTGFALVGGPARQDHPRAIEALKRLNRPYMVALPLVFQTTQEWEESDLGLHPVQVALQIAIPELDGAIEPIVLSGRDDATGKAHTLQDRVEAIAERAIRWASLRTKPRTDKKLAITVFSFPPDKGNVGTAAYLDVFGSIFRVLEEMKARGYSLGDELPRSPKELMEAVLKDPEAMEGAPELAIAHRMSVEEYERLTPYSARLEENWGKPPGSLNSDGTHLLVYGRHFGNVFVGVQPTFGYEGDPMRLLYSRSASPHHGFAAYYTYLEKIWGADAVLHFGTHGSLEFMPGKQMGMSDTCYPDSLIGALPNLYYYAANNPSEATIAKRRGYAATISYLTPPAENAGLYKGLKELGELVGSYQQLREGSRGVQIVNAIVETARQCSLDRDVALPEEDAAGLDIDARDAVVGAVYRQLMEIESRLLPCGLHTIGKPPTAEEAIATLVNIAALEREEDGLRSLPALLAEAKGRTIEDVYRGNDAGVLADVEFCRTLTEASRAAVGAMVRQVTGRDGRVSLRRNFGWLLGLLERIGIRLPSPWLRACRQAGFAKVDVAALDRLFEYLRFCLEQICADQEMESLLRALDGEYVLPGPGGDPIRNPGVLPSGKNIHALDPQAIPTRAAIAAAKGVVDRLLERQRQEQGAWPETIACVLWGTDNIKTYGESLAQILWFIGVRPLPDSLGRVNRLELIPLEELGRPRIDVVVNCSGVFRDLFINQMALIDQGVKLAAEADEPEESNFVRKHAREQAEAQGTTLREAATRVFSNASGSYSSNVNLAVENSTWEEEGELQEMYLSRKTFAFNADNPGEMNQKREVFESAMKTADVTFQNLDSAEISLTDVSHYFDSDPTKLIANLREDGKAPSSYIADTTTANAQVRSLSETIRLDSRTKLLNPKWYEGMLNSGYEGVREVAKRLNFTLGWSATSGQVDNFVYEEANNTFINDPEMRKRLMDLNPHSFRRIVGTLLEVHGRGYWETSDENIEQLQGLYQDIEDRIEGVSEG